METVHVHYDEFSGWVDPPAGLAPTLTEDLSCDAVVIGGGLNGMSTALRLAERGQDGVLLEAGHLPGVAGAGSVAAELVLQPKFGRPMMMGSLGLRTIWAVDRFNDLVNGSGRNARTGSMR